MTSVGSYSLNFADPDKVSNALAALVMSKAVLAVEREAKKEAPYQTRRLVNSITSRVEQGGKVGIVGTQKLEYALAIHEGSGLYGPKHAKYEIRPRNKKALAFLSPVGYALQGRTPLYRSAKTGGLVKNAALAKNSGRVIVRSVMHPGVKPNPFLRRGLTKAIPTIQSIIRQQGEQMLREAIGRI